MAFTPAQRIRIGLIGAGNWALHGHMRVLNLLPEYELVAVQSRRREASEKGRSVDAVWARMRHRTTRPTDDQLIAALKEYAAYLIPTIDRGEAPSIEASPLDLTQVPGGTGPPHSGIPAVM